MSLDRYLVKGAKYLTPAALISLAFSQTGFYILMAIIPLLLALKFLNDKYHIEEKLEDYRWFRKVQFYLNMRKLSKQSKSIN